MGYQMRLKLIRVGLLVLLANHYTTRGTQGHLRSVSDESCVERMLQDYIVFQILCVIICLALLGCFSCYG